MRRVKVLEAALDVALFVRRRDGHRLTTSGMKLLELAREAEHLFDTVPNIVGVPNAESQGRVRIATTEVGANWMLLPQVASFQAKHPGITLEIDASPRALDLLEDTETLALRFVRPQAGPHLMKRLGSVPYGIYAAPNLIEPSGKTKDSNPAASASYIGWAGPFAQIGIARWLRAAFNGASPSLALTTLHGHIEAARQGLGATALPLFIGRQLTDLVEVPGGRPEFSLDAWLVVPVQVSRIARMRAASQFIEQAVRSTLRPGRPPRRPIPKPA